MPRRPKDSNQLAKMVVDMTTGQTPNDSHDDAPARSAKAKGGNARAKALTPERRREIAKQGAAARWG